MCRASQRARPRHGCFSREGADAEYEGHYGKQVLDCISQLAPPLRLATMTFLAARNALRTNTAESIAQLTGGEFFHFHDAKDLKAGLIAVSNDVPNYYVLSFRPRAYARPARAACGDQGSSPCVSSPELSIGSTAIPPARVFCYGMDNPTQAVDIRPLYPPALARRPPPPP